MFDDELHDRDVGSFGINYEPDLDSYEYQQNIYLDYPESFEWSFSGPPPEMDYYEDNYLEPPRYSWENDITDLEYDSDSDLFMDVDYDRDDIDPLVSHIASIIKNYQLDGYLSKRYEVFINTFGIPVIDNDTILYASVSKENLEELDSKLLIIFAKHMIDKDHESFLCCLNKNIVQYLLDNENRCHLSSDDVDALLSYQQSLL